ncbi:family 20 glycosylhydrolase [Shewanella fidelis]|uniref:beta-N-acetylhexosaminidase n=1 Tax=Shewanella fidelis TaxID=173509 RepID=A0AAW8NTA2_9GAMM|nr:family 20 glycosylhydrolase [Shewanella fidelis]MDR8525124.1 carbohydate-binding domain-containing protein [Shewanella fidelis]MDW4811195.1 carbohydate-binding domain-containing protein [Shewanella fidelis]MDW4815026.1 carbohydate-binding domain-containing protein [Shewanella fidelis]MDW4819116.1 carbohydate-binding domain-containing protein [Shewanella fidelis]MDW4823206.1 carbohydate-binding domain-containing protein [Shewanella fidelis]
MNILKGLLPLTVALSSFNASADFSQAELNEFADKTSWSWQVVDNYHNGDKSHLANIELINQSNIDLPAGEADWVIYTNVIRPILTKESQGLAFQFVQGDLFKITPTANFKGLKAGEKLTIPFEADAWASSYSDFMPRSFITQNSLTPAVFSSTDTEDSSQYVKPLNQPEQYQRYNSPKDYWQKPTSTWRYDRYSAAQEYALTEKEAKRVIIPTPNQVKYRSSSTQLTGDWQISYQGRLKSEANLLADTLNKKLNAQLKVTPNNQPVQDKKLISLAVYDGDDNWAAESYSLEIDKNSIEIIAADNAGAFYAIQSLLSLTPSGTHSQITLPRLSANDAPYYEWRGFMYDMSRNFHGVEITKKLIDQMAHYKLNKLHLHLTEDESWRIEIEGLPELTQLGSQRCFDLSETECMLPTRGSGPFKTSKTNGFYSKQEFVDILKYAKERHIEVIPEIDMPGHARAAIKAMELRHDKLLKAGDKAAAKAYLLSDPNDKSVYSTMQFFTDNSINVCMDSTYNFVDKVAYELQQMYRQAGLKLSNVHIGGDEVGVGSWTASPICNELYQTAGSGVKGPADLKAYFTRRASEVLAARGLNISAWEDGIMYDRITPFPIEQFANDKVYVHAWDNIWEWGVSDRAYRLANEGYHSILSMGTHLYFDHPQEPDPAERGLYWAARYTDVEKVFNFIPEDVYANADFTRTGKPIENLEDLVGRALPQLQKPENIAGIQGQVWSETIRTPEQLGEMVFPRIIALAERGWHKNSVPASEQQQKARQWAEFASVLAQKEYPKLEEAGISFYLPIPGAKLVDNQIHIISQLPGLTIEYSLDEGATWQLYREPIAQSDAIQVRSRSGEHTSRTGYFK